MPEIGQDAKTPGSVIDYESDAIHGVMRRWDGLDRDISESNLRASRKVPDVIERPQLRFLARNRQRAFRDVDRHPELSLVDTQASAMVAVVVRDYQRVNVFDVTTVRGQPILGLPPADPGIEEKPDAARFDVNAIAVASGLQGDDFHRHIVLR